MPVTSEGAVIKSHYYCPKQLWKKLQAYMKKNNLGWNAALNTITDQALDDEGNLRIKEE